MSRGKGCLKQSLGEDVRGTKKALHEITSRQRMEGERREDGVRVIWEALKINSTKK